jgi:hypothetical protein
MSAQRRVGDSVSGQLGEEVLSGEESVVGQRGKRAYHAMLQACVRV